MSVFAVYNSKGGAGKSTTAVNLAWTAALEGQPTLLWDLDPQGASSFLLQECQGLEHSAKKLLAGKRDWQEEVRPTAVGNLSLIPGDVSFRHWDLWLGEQDRGKKILNEWLKPLRQQFPVILLDCPPGITLLSENLFRAADAMVIPVVPSPLGLRTLDQVRSVLQKLDRQVPEVLPFLSMVDRRKAAHRGVAEALPEGFLSTVVPLLSEIERTLQAGGPRVWTRSTRVRGIYQGLWEEITQRVPGAWGEARARP